MAWIEGTEKQTFVVDAPLEAVVDFFADPDKFRHCLGQLDSYEEVEPGVWKWVLQEKAEKGITFQGVYTVRYEREDSSVRWTTVSEGNMRSEGRASCTARGDKTEVVYEETIATDLPIPKLAAKVFRPIVAREIRKGVGTYLECARARLQGSTGASA